MIGKLASQLIVVFMVVTTFVQHHVFAQDKVSLQVKVFDQNLKPLPNAQVALNSLDFFVVNSKGTAIIEITQSELPVKSIRVKDERYEAASWNLSKGTIEIIIRPVSYKIIRGTTAFEDGTGLASTSVKFHGSKTVTVMSDPSGKFDLPISLYEKINSASQFEIDNILVTGITVNGDAVMLSVERPRPKQAIPKQTTAVTKPDVQEFDVAKLDSITTLPEFYSVLRNISVNDLDESTRAIVDEKFRKLTAIRQDSIRARQATYIRNISDSSPVVTDIRNLLRQATDEQSTLKTNREEFESKIGVISDKLERGVRNLSENDRTSLLHDIDNLEMLLTENESQFYKNQNDYREIINTLREKYLEVETLQRQLSEAERLRIEQDKDFRQRILGVGSIVVMFGLLIILLITFSSRLRRQTKSLKVANARIEEINGNLEAIVAKRTQLLEEANKELDTFLYRASHDLRSPSLSLMGLSNIIDHIDREEMVHHVREAIANMNRVINKLVDISEISQESANVHAVNVLAIISSIRNKHLVTGDIVSRSRYGGLHGISNRPIRFDVDCTPDLQINTSQSLLEIILNNLVDNAIFFASLKHSSQPVHIEIKAMITNTNLVITVTDNGIGIAKVIRPNIFNMFFKGNEASKGSGLGLYTVEKCVAALHGVVTFESEEGQYTRFFVTIPPVQ